jgi:hypothetical protein
MTVLDVSSTPPTLLRNGELNAILQPATGRRGADMGLIALEFTSTGNSMHHWRHDSGLCTNA